MRAEVRSGVVVEYDSHVGLGRVRDSDGDELFFHCTEIADGTREIDPGQTVSFVVAPAHKGVFQATRLAVVSTEHTLSPT